MSDNKNKKFQIRVSDDERQEWNALAQELGLLHESALIRYAINQLRKKTPKRKED